MKAAILEYKRTWSTYGDYVWWFRKVWVLRQNKNTARIWSWREPFTRLVHRQAVNEKVKPL